MQWDQESFQKLYKQICQFDAHLGMDFEIHTPGDVTYRLALTDAHQSSPKSIHGGTLAAMMDATLGLSALSFAVTKGQLCSTVEFKINYLEPAKPGDVLEGRGELDFTGNRLVVTSAKIWEKESGKLLAKGMGTFNLYPMDKHDWLSEQQKQKDNDS